MKSSAGTVLSDEDMQGIMEDIIKGQDLALVAQARALAGGAEPGNLIKLKLPDGTTRCQGMVGPGFRAQRSQFELPDGTRCQGLKCLMTSDTSVTLTLRHLWNTGGSDDAVSAGAGLR